MDGEEGVNVPCEIEERVLLSGGVESDMMGLCKANEFETICSLPGNR